MRIWITNGHWKHILSNSQSVFSAPNVHRKIEKYSTNVSRQIKRVLITMTKKSVHPNLRFSPSLSFTHDLQYAHVWPQWLSPSGRISGLAFANGQTWKTKLFHKPPLLSIYKILATLRIIRSMHISMRRKLLVINSFWANKQPNAKDLIHEHSWSNKTERNTKKHPWKGFFLRNHQSIFLHILWW